MRKALALLLCVAATASRGADMLDIDGAFGNTEGCEHLRTGDSVSDLRLLLRPDSLEGAVIGCEFVEVRRASDGTQAVTGLCSHEGEEEMHVRQFVVAPDPQDGQALLVFEDGALWNRVTACE